MKIPHSQKFALYAALALFSVTLSHGATLWTGAVDSDIKNAGNWDNGLPNNSGSNDGTINDGSTVVTDNRSDLSYANYVVSGGSTIQHPVLATNNGLRWGSGTITLNSGGTLDVLYEGQTQMGRDGSLSATLNMYSGSIANFAGSLAVGRDNNAFVNQYGGTLTIASSLFVSENAGQSGAGSIFTLSGGTVTANAFDVNHNNDPTNLNHFNFTTGSTGTLTVLQDNFNFAAFIGDGDIRLDGNASSDLADFKINTTVGGQTTLSLIPEPGTIGLLSFAGLLFAGFRRR